MSVFAEKRYSFKIETNFKFKRKMYYELQDFLQHSKKSIASLCGPRRTGKTILLKQLAADFGYYYVNFKDVADDDAGAEIIGNVAKDIRTFTVSVWLLDEFTSLKDYDVLIRILVNAYEECEDCFTKIVFTGSQSFAIQSLCLRNFGSSAEYFKLSFLSFHEYCVFKGIGEVSILDNFTLDDAVKLQEIKEDSYIEYLFDTYSFNIVIQNNLEYLQSCIGETIESNRNSVNNNGVLEVNATAREINEIYYALLYSLHNDIGYDTLLKGERLNAVATMYRAEKIANGEEPLFKQKDFIIEVQGMLHDFYDRVCKMNSHKFASIINFLAKLDLIYFTTNNRNSFSLDSYLDGEIEKSPKDFMKSFTINVCHPAFYCNVLNEICGRLQLKYPQLKNRELLSKVLLGSVVECDVLHSVSQYLNVNLLYKLNKFKNGSKYSEIDLACTELRIAVEISVADKKINKTHFAEFEEIADWDWYLLGTKLEEGRPKRIPYFIFKFIFDSFLYQ